MAQNQKSYDNEFKAQAVKLAQEIGGHKAANGIASLVVTLIMYIIGEAMKNSQLKHSSERQESNELLTEAVLDFTEGMGIIKTYNILGDKSKALSNSFGESCDKNFFKNFSVAKNPWKI